MPAARCSIDNIDFPVKVGRKFKGICPACGEKLSTFSNVEPNEDWEARLEAAQRRLEALENEATIIGTPVIDVPVYEENGLLWVSNFELFPALGYRPSEEFFRFKVGDTLYEIQGWHESARRWWVEEVPS